MGSLIDSTALLDCGVTVKIPPEVRGYERYTTIPAATAMITMTTTAMIVVVDPTPEPLITLGRLIEVI